MTRYALDQTRGALIALWETGGGDIATTVAELQKDTPPRQALRLAEALTGLSRAAWRCYTHPASAADSLEVNTEGWRRQGEREAFSGVLSSIDKPELPHNGHVIQSYIAVEEAAHRIGRALHALADADLSARVAADVEAELKAIEQAELGNLSGRARQAVMLTREDASPVQVAEADRLLREDPLGGDALFTEVDPTAAAVAAAHWLQAAADVAAEQSGLPATGIVQEADNIEALNHETPTLVLQLMEAGATPHQAVTALVREAMRVAAGEADADTLKAKISC